MAEHLPNTYQPKTAELMGGKKQGDAQGILKTIIPFFLIIIVYAPIAWYLIHNGEFNADEGFYCLVARKAMEGRVPYKDFAYTQMPLLPYVNGAAMKIFGFGFLQQRTINAFWGLLTLATVFYIGLRLGDKKVGFMAAWMTCTSLFWVHYVCMGKTYAAAGLFLMLAMLGISLPRPYYKKALVFSAAGILAVGCRLTVAPAVFVLGVFLLLQAKTAKDKIIGVVWPVFTGVILLLPFLLADSENFIFWNIRYHLATTFNRKGWPTFTEHLRLAPGVLLIMAAGIILIISKIKRFKIQELSALAASAAGIFTQLGLKSSYGENSAPFVPLGAMGAAIILSKWEHFKERYFVILLLSVLMWLGARPTIDKHTPEALFNTAKFVKAHTDPGSSLLTCFPIVAIESQREVLDGLEMGTFSLTSEMSEAKARRLHIVTPGMLTEWVKTKKAGAVVLDCMPTTWNFYWSVPSLQQVNQKEMGFFTQALKEQYNLAFTECPFEVFLPKSTGRLEP
jgi:hypothetical protein